MNAASREGYLEVVKWLHFNRSEGCSTNAIDLAAQNGHLGVVKWLHSNRSEGCSAYALLTAAQAGHKNIVKYLVENSLVTDRDSLRYAMEFAQLSGHHFIIEFLSSVLN